MTGQPTAGDFLADEARALLTRVERLKPFILQETMLPAAALLPRTLVAIEDLLLCERAKLHGLGQSYLRWLAGPGRSAPVTEQQRKFTVIRLRLNEHLAQLDLFADAITQRSESETGLWLSGLDVAAHDALRLNDGVGEMEEVPVICYLDRGPGAAIRRARTRLPGGVANPVAVIRVPRERMVGHGIASSLVHEVGHQGAALLDLVPSLRAELQRRSQSAEDAWHCWAAWISEIIADFWSVAKLGIGSTLGLIGVVSLPRPFVFRFTLDDPHPFPWIRVLVSAAIGDRLYPDPQWTQVARLWQQMYPPSTAPDRVAEVIEMLEPTLAQLADLIATHVPARLNGPTLQDALAHESRNPDALRELFTESTRQSAARVRPVHRFAMLGQARWDRRLAAGQESRVTDRMLTGLAAKSTMQMAMSTARIPSAISERQ
ncbi:hypothetical protein LWC34_49720 [Kibdelosporangium philippinense]|uniref:HEXXH motif-containing protein n=2 Tax=Kibdelosporangium philippinense TaxID=211113 RepID=A0ABS8ZT02_9PSEU|nr:hypothetical protein [Kibdelosporangium philippinense]MCE7010831.1 hypothetical protein [Kibdelosporangium philippinense]